MNCNDHVVTSSGSYGIRVMDQVVVKNCEVQNTTSAAFLLQDSAQAIACLATNNEAHGFKLEDNAQAESCRALNNSTLASHYGFTLKNNAQVMNSHVEGSSSGVLAENHSQVTDCTVIGDNPNESNSYGFNLDGHAQIQGGTASGRYYGIWMSTSTTAEGTRVENNRTGLQMYFYSRADSITASNNRTGFIVMGTHGAELWHSTASNNYFGFVMGHIGSSPNVGVVGDCLAIQNQRAFQTSDQATIINSVAVDNRYGFRLGGQSQVLSTQDCENCQFTQSAAIRNERASYQGDFYGPGDGFYLQDEASVGGDRPTLSLQNGDHGFTLLGAASIENVIARNNGGSAILVDAGSDATVAPTVNTGSSFCDSDASDLFFMDDDPENSISISGSFIAESIQGDYQVPEGETLELVECPEAGNTTLTHPEGWGLVSLPVFVDTPQLTDLFPTAIENTLYSFADNGFVPETELTPGAGYFVRFTGPSQSTQPTQSILYTTQEVTEGWNLIGGLSVPVAKENIVDPSGVLILNSLYTLDNGSYQAATELEPGKGYWVRAERPGIISLVGVPALD